MSLSTSILGPYDDLTTSEKMLISAAIPPDVRERLFTYFLPRRGALDKVVSRVIYLLDVYLDLHPELSKFNEYDREVIVNKFYNEITLFLRDLDPRKLVPEETNPNPRDLDAML